LVYRCPFRNLRRAITLMRHVQDPLLTPLGGRW
jgi:hypothetical protein